MAHEGERYCCVVIVRDTHRRGIRGHVYEVRCDCGASLLTSLRQLKNAEMNMCDDCKKYGRRVSPEPSADAKEKT